MCITVERAHFDLVAKRIRKTFARLIAETPLRSAEFLLELEHDYAEAAIVFRDFPKTHGNIIRDAVGIALSGRVCGLSECEKKFSFLSGDNVSVDNFFITTTGVRKKAPAARVNFPGNRLARKVLALMTRREEMMPVFEIVLHQPVLESVTVRVNASTAAAAQAKAVAKANDGCYDFSDGEGYGTAYVAGCSELWDDDAMGAMCDVEPSCLDPTEGLGRAVENLLDAVPSSFAASDAAVDLRKAFERWKQEAR